MNIWMELVGFSAGALVVCSVVQRAWRVAHNFERAGTEDDRRNTMQCLGNALLFIYSYNSGGVALPIMCAISVLSISFLIIAKHARSGKY